MNESIALCAIRAEKENHEGHFAECLCEIITAIRLLNEKLPDSIASQKKLTVADLGKQFTDWIKRQHFRGELPLDLKVCIGDFDIIRRN